MNNQRGFTLVEMILALLISAILAGVIIEIIAGPIKSYFWVTQRVLVVQEAELALDLLQREVTQALSPTIITSNLSDKQTVSFHKIISSGFAQAENIESHSLVLLTKLDNDLEMNKVYYVHFIDDENPNKLYRAKLTTEHNKTYVTLDEKVVLKQIITPIQLHVLSELITYRCDSATHVLERFENKETALVNNMIKACRFSKMHDAKATMVFLNVEVKSPGKEPIAMTYPVYVEHVI